MVVSGFCRTYKMPVNLYVKKRTMQMPFAERCQSISMTILLY